MVFVSDECNVPDELRTDEFVLVPLGPQHAELDYEALMSSKEALRNSVMARHDLDQLTFEDNLAGLEAHDRDHRDRVSFTFTVLTPDHQQCLGCVYVMPHRVNLDALGVEPGLASTVAFDEAVVGFWIRQSRLADDLDARMLDALIPWLQQEWPFSRVSFYVDERDQRQLGLLRRTGLAQRFAVDAPSEEGVSAARLLIFG